MLQLGQETNDSDSESSERDKDRSMLDGIWTSKQKTTSFFDVTAQLSVSPPDSVPHLPQLQPVIEACDYLNCEGNVTQNFHMFGGQRQSPPDVHLPFKELHVWYKVHLQQKAYHDPSSIASMLTVHAHPPDCLLKYGQYDTAIMNVDDQWQWPSSGLQGHAIVHVHLIMCPVLPRGSSGVNWFSDHFLIYAQCFDIIPQEQFS
ncbi:hypothetical protein BKA83DRAFT_4128916 [Pisolithus microcarpus]|nr:hypothetical protein BKA83DRAFT_4128916 [Pisolithus microcarpus]